ncbi:hypothetical protein PCANB_000703 [Pneumocystis canis]|nr:hypothetical protein PCANB_000703 [Pneumocystis canis]
MKDDLWSKESIEDSIKHCLKKGLIFLVYIQEGENTEWIDKLLNSDICDEIRQKTVSLKLLNGTDDAALFKQMVVVNSVPSIFLIKDGSVGKSFYENSTAKDLIESIRALSIKKSLPEVLEQGVSNEGLSSIHKKNTQHLESMKKMEQQTNSINADHVKKSDKEEQKCVLKRVNKEKMKEHYRDSTQSTSSVGDRIIQENIKNECSLNVRLLNGSSIQARHFTFKNTLKDVRLWIDENRTDNKMPYNIIQVYPKRRFSASEEIVSLEALNLCPSATLVLTPLKNVTAAYTGSNKSYFSKLFGIITSYFISSIYSIFNWIPRFSGRNNVVKKIDQCKRIIFSSDNQKISALQNKNKDKNIWYNGNTINQELPKEKINDVSID